MKQVLRELAARSGTLAALHRWRNSRCLTVVAFHRVLDRADPRWPTADPRWTMERTLFVACLDFLAAHYSVVSLERLQRHRQQAEPLPPRPLLITFDDGWADNEEVALPALTARSLPAVVFVAAEAVGAARGFWQEQLLALWVSQGGSLSDTRVQAGAGWQALALGLGLAALPSGRAGLDALLAALGGRDPSERLALLGDLPGWPPATARRAMLDEAQIGRLVAGGVAIGAHGLTHEPLTSVPDPGHELREARRRLCELAGAPVTALSYPHGRCTPELVQLAREAGYELQFDSREGLCRLPLGSPPLGRIFLPGALLPADAGARPAARLATGLFLQPRLNR